ncbi:hypothetical protein [Micromonospora sp. NPDC050495]|uniref:DUF6993 domain-containing protein n=1 Tax=Micromonospora sp. NPDC050495 TaxID=3154936 RepID=UPI0033F95DCD
MGDGRAAYAAPVRAPAPTIGSARPRLAGLVLAALMLAACGSPPPAPGIAPTAIAARTPQDASHTPAHPDPSASVIRCEWLGPAGRYDPAYCQRVVDDERIRRRLTVEQRAEAEAAAEAVGRAIDRMTFGCAEPVTQECLAEQARRRMFPPTDSPEQATDRVRRAISAAGYPDIDVRQAQPTDPAPRDAIVYAVRAGGGCVVGHLATGGRGGGQRRVLGTLPNGQCLA